MERGPILNMLSIFYPNVRHTLSNMLVFCVCVFAWSVIFNRLTLCSPKPKDELIKDLILNEYIGSGKDQVKNRDAYTELLGDLFFTIPAIKTANAHRGYYFKDFCKSVQCLMNTFTYCTWFSFLSHLDAGAAVYLYEYQHPPYFLQKKRPSFVKSDHADELFTVFGFCFTTSHIKLIGKFRLHKPTNTRYNHLRIGPSWTIFSIWNGLAW